MALEHSGWWGLGPTFFIPGAPKCGTSTLYVHLKAHPHVCMSDPKEPNFFYSHFGDREYLEARYRHQTDERIFGDATATYMIHPEVPGRIHDAVPDAKFIIALREPIARAISQYEYRVQKGSEVRPFSEIVEEGLSAEILSFSAYGTHFSRFFALFPMDRFLFVQTTELATDPEGTMAKVFRFLDVEPIAVDRETRSNVTRTPGSEKTRLVLSLLRRTRVQRLVPHSLRPQMHRVLSGIMAIGSSDRRTEIKPRDRMRLIELFEAEVDMLEAATGLAFPAWREVWAAPPPAGEQSS
jgi:hypothetical protein